MFEHNRIKTLACTLAILSSAGGAAAVDGVIEINQAAALAGGISPADTPGFPVTLESHQSYRLTSSLTVSNGAVSAIAVPFSEHHQSITLDLNGFSVRCNTSGSGTFFVPCENSSATGIDLVSANTSKIANGTVEGFAGFGVRVGQGGHIEGVHAIANGRSTSSVDGGIWCSSRCLVRRAIALGNGGFGIGVGADSRIIDSRSSDNQTDGFRINHNSLATGNVASDNGASGFRVLDGVSLRENLASGNADYAIYGNGTLTYTYGHNMLRGNGAGSLGGTSSTAIQVGSNFCQTNTICP